MPDNYNPVEFGELKAEVRNVLGAVREVKDLVRAQNGRVYRLEEKAAEIKKDVSKMNMRLSNVEDMPLKIENRNLKDKLRHHAPQAAMTTGGLGALWLLVDKLLPYIEKLISQ